MPSRSVSTSHAMSMGTPTVNELSSFIGLRSLFRLQTRSLSDGRLLDGRFSLGRRRLPGVEAG